MTKLHLNINQILYASEFHQTALELQNTKPAYCLFKKQNISNVFLKMSLVLEVMLVAKTSY